MVFGLRNINRTNKRIIYFALFIFAAVAAAVILASMAAERSGMYWTGLIDSDAVVDRPSDNRGFFMVDVSDLISESDVDSELAETEKETVPIGVGPIPSLPSLTMDELKLYGILSKGDGLISSEDASLLDEDIHWQEVVLDEGDTVESIAKEYAVSPDDIRKANAMSPKQKVEEGDVLFVPDSHNDVARTLQFVKKFQQVDAEESKKAKNLSITAYVVKDGDSLWSIADRFDLELDTIIGSNKLKDINMLKLGTTLRIPNQNGIFVRVEKNDKLSVLADRYGSTKSAVLFANGMKDGSALKVGQEIFLPGARIVAVAESSKGGRKASRAVTSKITGSVRRFGWPVMGKISSTFGWRRSPFGHRRVFHAGLDIRAPKGRAIVAAAEGRVVHSNWMSGYGKTIVIVHQGGYSTLYGHCSSLLARSGAYVQRGQLIARVGSTGRSTGNHLHFEVRRGGTPMNPINFLR